MSGYRNYVPWTKNNNTPSNYSNSSTKKESTTPKYESTYSRTRNDAKKNEDKNVSSTLGGKYTYNTGYNRDNSTTKDTGPTAQKSDIHTRYYDKKESHPPITYRTLTRTGTSRSRDPSPVADKSTSSDSYSYNRLYPRPYTRSVSRERLDNTSTTTTTIPKYTGRSSINKDDLKYPVNVGRERTESTSSTTSKYSATTKDDTPKYNIGLTRDRSESNTTIPKYTGKSSTIRDDLTNKYQLNKSSRNTSREDLTTSRFKSSREDLNKPSQKYINSRFLPKNTVEKSYPSYRPTSGTAKSSEILRKNRELLNVINTQSETRSISRASSIAPEDSTKSKSSEESNEYVEMETITVITRSTSPNPPSQTNIQRIRRLEVARLIEKQISRPVKRRPMVDKEMQSDRLDDSTRYSRFAGASRISATPLSSYLDLKYSSPSSSSKYSKYTSQSKETSEEKSKKSTDDASKSLSSSNSAKNFTQSSSKSDVKTSDIQNSSKTKSKLTPPKNMDKKLPPHIPKSDSSTKVVNSLHSLNTPNKDFRKSVLNMNPDGKSKKKSSTRSNSLSSAESECSEANDTNQKQSKLPQKIDNASDPLKTRRSFTRSPSSTSDSTTTSGSEDDSKSKSNKIKKLQSAGSSRTSMISADELSYDTTPKPPVSPRTKSDHSKSDHSRSETEAKSFLMRALAPVTNLFKGKQDSNEKVNWIDSSSAENISELASNKEVSKQSSNDKSSKAKLINLVKHDSRGSESSERKLKKEKARITIKRIESGEKAWWLQSNENSEKRDSNESATGEKPQWIIGGSDAVDGDSIASNEYCNRYNIRHIDSGERAWWMTSSENLANTEENLENSNNDAKGAKGDKKVYKIRPIESGEKAWWLESENSDNKSDPKSKKPYTISHVASGERAWWLEANNHDYYNQSDESDSDNEIPLGDRASPEGLEMPREEEQNRLSPYDNVGRDKPKRPNHIPLFISRHTNIDDILGGSGLSLSPLMDRIFSYQEPIRNFDDDDCEEVDATQVKIHDSTPQHGIFQPARLDAIGSPLKGYTTNCRKLDDAALQLYKDGDYGSYLDLEASISEQQEEFEGFQSNKKNSIVLRTQLSVRVHTIIEKLYKSEGRELRRALFSLKQIFQEDKDLVHEFVQNDGLSCLIKVGSEADQNYQNYILRALGQVMLYVDGMNGVMEHNKTIQWLYTLISSKFRLVVKTALKLLLVFVEYTDTNCLLLIKAINLVDCSQGSLPWTNIMKLLKDFDSADTELLIYATTLINKCLNGIPDQDTYYDQTDSLEEQGIESIIQRYMSKPGTDLDLLQQFQIYEAVLQYEDGEDKGTPIRHLDENIRKTLRSRKSMCETSERRKSRRHSTGTTPVHSALNNRNISLQANNEDDDESSSSQSSGINTNLNGSYKDNNKAHEAGVTPALRRRRERAERQRSFMREQQENAALLRGSLSPTDNENIENGNNNYTNGLQQRINNGNNVLNRTNSRKDLTPLLNAVNKLDSEEQNGLSKQPWILSMMYQKNDQNDNNVDDIENTNETERNLIMQLKENTVKDLTQKLTNQNILHSPTSDENKINRIGDMSGLISKAKEGLAKSKSQANVLKSPTGDNIPKVIEVKKSENELRWEELVANMNRPLNLCDMDFTDLASDDDADILTPIIQSNGIPPPPPPLLNDNGITPPPPPLNSSGKIPSIIPPSPPVFGGNLQRNNKIAETKIPIKKNKKTVKLFWKEVRDDPVATIKLKSGFIWDELTPVTVDTQKLEHLFESRAKDLITKKQQEMNKNKEIIVLDPKRSNAINIGMTKLPPPRSIKTAILKMDATIMNREGIEKLLTMLPTEEERTKIQEAQSANPDLPLGSAEQFLLTLASISELPARLKLWAFKLDFENTEREIAEPLMDLKQGMELLKMNKTFRAILSTLLSIGNFLNGNEVKGFQIEYLSKVPEVKDTVHKHSLLHHLCHIVMEKFSDASDLYSEIGAITRASKIDFDELTLNIQRLEADCKASWDHLKLIAKHDGSTMMKVKMSDFLADCAERIILLGIIHRKVMNRFHKFLLWLGIPLHQISETKPNELCRVVSEFALEYRTTRERVLQQLEKKANHRERNKTRGKMITETGKFRSKEDRADAELRQLLGSDISDVDSLQGTLPWRRTRRESSRFLGQINGNLTDGDDEILESLVKTATKVPTRSAQRERKRTRHADRKSLRRTLKNGLSEEEKKHLSAYIKGY